MRPSILSQFFYSNNLMVRFSPGVKPNSPWNQKFDSTDKDWSYWFLQKCLQYEGAVTLFGLWENPSKNQICTTPKKFFARDLRTYFLSECRDLRERAAKSGPYAKLIGCDRATVFNPVWKGCK